MARFQVFFRRIEIADQAALDAMTAIDVRGVEDLYAALVNPTGAALNAGTTVALDMSGDETFAAPDFPPASPAGNLGPALEFQGTAGGPIPGAPCNFVRPRGTLNAADNGANLYIMGRVYEE